MKLAIKSTLYQRTKGRPARRLTPGAKPPIILLPRKNRDSVRWLYESVMKLRKSEVFTSARLDV